ncbi:K(+)/H(+) antiporter NhaP2 [Lignipirellula cremea]|uniref:K(+)/H(+) antiporter NhaP2 n=1 Tax=Lignipirellula cremea TaxID=2528010 RepID=A0A518DTY8_9BACT|nr:K(+)/H(+) antiporter NhaP2 [Lignipirellula cremea]
MEHSEHLLLYYLAGVALLGVSAQWLAWRLRLPSILLLLSFGVVLGIFLPPDAVFQRLSPHQEIDSDLFLFPIVSLSVAIIMLEGGLTLRLSELKQSGGVVLRLCTLGAIVSWVLTAIAAWWVLGFDARLATLIGAILVVTGPTVIAPLLRHIQPKRRIGSIVKWEGIVIDPVGAVLAVLVFEAISSESGASAPIIAWALTKTILVGGSAGLALGVLIEWAFSRYWIPDFLQGAFVLSAALASFAWSNHLQNESGLVTVTVLGIYLANQKTVSLKHVAEFKEHLVVLLIACLFIVLGSRVELAQVWQLGWPGAVFVAAMILIVRPASVALSTIGCDLNWREKVFLSFLAPRGIVAAAVASIFAIKAAKHFTSIDMVEQSEEMAAVAFLVIFGTVLVYGLFSGVVARLLGLADPNPQGVLIAGAGTAARTIAKALHDNGVLVLVVDTNFRHVAAARMEGMRAECASILSEHVAEELELGGIGRLMALTPNDTVNVLAVRVFTHHFGRQNVYQLPPAEGGAGAREAVGRQLQGRRLFDKNMSYEKLSQLLGPGGACLIKRTKLTEEFTLSDYRVQYNDAPVLMFVISEGGTVRIITADNETPPQAGDTILAIVPQQTPVHYEEDEEEGAAEKEASSGKEKPPAENPNNNQPDQDKPAGEKPAR